MGLLIFFGTAGIIYIVFDRVFSTKQTLVFPNNDEINQLQIGQNNEIVNANISNDKLILIIKLNQESYIKGKYQIVVFDLKKGKKINNFFIK
tara:strand:+ start:1286 stop:1561 length:276 start_codon:yes stop_codon:yes gene_type:complete